jgi:hypothetical protein
VTRRQAYEDQAAAGQHQHQDHSGAAVRNDVAPVGSLDPAPPCFRESAETELHYPATAPSLRITANIAA